MKHREIFDIHTHILPGVDDGSDSMKTTMEMLRMAYSQGVRAVMATPHGSVSRVSPARCRRLLEEVKEQAQQKFPDLKIYLGEEVFYSRECIEHLNSGKLLPMAGTSYVLTEYPYTIPYRELYSAVRELVWARYRPILAHIERYRCLKDGDRAEELSECGAYLQINFSSIGGSCLNGTARWCRRQLSAGRIHFLGSDMHNLGNRRPELEKALEWMERHLEEDYLREILWENAEKMVRDEPV